MKTKAEGGSINTGQNFSKVLDEYEAARPGYSRENIEKITEVSGITSGSKILDIGCGTGIVAGIFSELGYDISGLDPDRKLTEEASSRYTGQGIDFITSTFEEAELPQEHYDLLVSATAFHWIDPKTRYQKSHKILKDEGHIALLWHVLSFEESNLLSGTKRLFNEHCPSYSSKDMDFLYQFTREIMDSDYFEMKTALRIPNYRQYDMLDYDKLIASFSWVEELDPEQRSAFDAGLADMISRNAFPVIVPWQEILIVAKKKDLNT